MLEFWQCSLLDTRMPWNITLTTTKYSRFESHTDSSSPDYVLLVQEAASHLYNAAGRIVSRKLLIIKSPENSALRSQMPEYSICLQIRTGASRTFVLHEI
jgi:hypothetical protein